MKIYYYFNDCFVVPVEAILDQEILTAKIDFRPYRRSKKEKKRIDESKSFYS